MLRSLVWLVLCALLIGATAHTEEPRAAVAEPHLTREQIVARIADLRRILTPEGIQSLEAIDIDGTRQWISIRGLNRSNPVLLMIHGGSGTPMMPSSWAFQTPWEDFFTVVQWDQRGVGKNYAAADRDSLAPTMTVERHVRDAEEVVAYLRRRLGKDKITIIGYSWGTQIGLRLAQRRPEWLHAYVGVGQTTERRNEDYIYARLLNLARRDGNTRALAELQAIAPYPGPDGNSPLESTLLVRKWARAYNGGWYGRNELDLFNALGEWSPEYTAAELSARPDAAEFALRHLLPDLASKRDVGTQFAVPVVFLVGRHDLFTPYERAVRFFERIEAPHKAFVTFERSAHFPMFEEPGRFLMALVEHVLPLTGEAQNFTQNVPLAGPRE